MSDHGRLRWFEEISELGITAFELFGSSNAFDDLGNRLVSLSR